MDEKSVNNTIISTGGGFYQQTIFVHWVKSFICNPHLKEFLTMSTIHLAKEIEKTPSLQNIEAKKAL